MVLAGTLILKNGQPQIALRAVADNLGVEGSHDPSHRIQTQSKGREAQTEP